jgi:crossover junction endodeoxyribonuclease RusA
MISITLDWPDSDLSPNKRISRHRKIEAIKKAKYMGYILTLEAKAGQNADLSGDLILAIRIYPPDKRRYDVDNVLASLKPAIDGVCRGLDIDDRQFTKIHIERREVRKPGSVEIVIRRDIS